MTVREQVSLKAPRTYRPNVGIMIINKDKKVWVGRRTDALPDTVFCKQMPQGGIDEGETPVQAAWREMGEETGLTAEHANLIAESKDWIFYDFPKDFKGILPYGFDGQKQKWFLFQLNGDDSCFDLHRHKYDEFSSFEWMDLDQLPNIIIPFKKEVYTKIVAEFSPIIARL